MEIKVLSWNVWGGQYLSEIVKFLQEANADLIALQEVIQDLDGSNNTAELIANSLGYHWTWAPGFEVETAKYFKKLESKTVVIGNAILTKFPILETKIHELPGEKKRTVSEAVVEVNNNRLHVFSAHLIHTHQKAINLQDAQAQDLLKLVPQKDAIVMGDFNAVPKSSAIQIISQTLQNTDTNPSLPTWSVYPEGCTVCNPQAVHSRLDYIFTSKDIKSRHFNVSDSKASDHLPVSVVIDL